MSNLKFLASQLGLSITTVSRALDDYDDVADATRNRVRALARELNYQPNAAARSLRRQKSHAVAVALPPSASPASVSGLFNMLMDVGITLGTSGYDLLMLPTASAASEMDSLQRMIDGRRIDAVILVRTRIHDRRVSYLEDKGIPFISHGRTASKQPHAFIDGDGEQGFRDATRWLIELGHTHIAHIAAPQELMFANLRRNGWLGAMQDNGISTPQEEHVKAPTEFEGHAAARRLLATADPPTALLCATDMIAIGAMTAVKEIGLTPGVDVSIVGHDGLLVGAYCDPPLSTMDICANDVGAQLADMLLKRIGGADPRDLQVVLPVRQILRKTHSSPRPRLPQVTRKRQSSIKRSTNRRET